MDLDVTRKKIMRGQILEILRTSLPGGASDILISNALGAVDMGDGRAIIRAECQYLEEKKYLTMKEVDSGNMQYICRLTTKGRDLIENPKKLEDVGIIIGVIR